MDFMYVAGQILLGLVFLGSVLGCLGLFNAMLLIWGDQDGRKFGLMSHVGVWLASVVLMAGIIHASVVNGWLGFANVRW